MIPTYNRFARHWVWFIPSRTFRCLYFVVARDHVVLTNNYGGQMPGFVEVGVFWHGWRHGFRWIWIWRRP